MFLRAAGITHHVRLDGPDGAPPLLMLHSLGTEGAVWEAQAAALEADWRAGDAPPGDAAAESLAEDREAVP